MNVSQVINHINDDTYDDDITVTDVPQGEFLAVTSMVVPDGSDTREISVELMMLEQAPGGISHANSGLFVRQAGEQKVSVKVFRDGQELAEHTISYS